MKCQVCGSEIADGLSSCPICGSPQVKPKKEVSLLEQMQTAQSLLHAIPALQKRVDDLSYQIESQKEEYVEKKNGRLALFVAVLISLFVAYFTMNAVNLIVWNLTSTPVGTNGTTNHLSLSSNILNTLLIVVFIIVFVISRKFITKYIDKKNKDEKERVEQHNRDVEVSSQDLRKEIEDALNRVFAAQKKWQEECASWYPMDYCDLASVDFFVSALRNHRADTLKEVINLWEHEKRMNTAEAQRAEQTAKQEAMVSQQKLSNLLNFGSLLVQGKMLCNQKDIVSKLGDISVNTKNIAWDTGQFSNRNRSISQQVLSHFSK